MKESCEKCLISTTSQFIPINKLGLPVRPSRQFRHVNEAFVDSLKEALLQEPSGSHGCLFVVAKGIASKETFNAAKKDAYEYEVLDGTHLMLATKKLHAQLPENIYYQGRMARIYCGLTDDQAIYLGAMHQKSSSFCHDITYREEVERCRSQLYGELDLQNEPPKPQPSWRDDCSRILYKDISSGEILLKNLKKEADKTKTLNTVQSAVMSFFKLEGWDEVVRRFGTMVNIEKLWRFKGNFEASYDFQVFLKRLKESESARCGATEDGQVVARVEEFSTRDGHNKGGAIFPHSLEEVTQSMELYKSTYEGVSLALGVVGFDEKEQLEVEEKCIGIVKPLSRLNFTVLSSFNCTIMCPVCWAHVVTETFAKEGASLTQQGFVYHKQELRRKQSTVMQEVVSSFIVGHWASSRVVGSSHVNYVSPPKNIVEVTAATIGEEYPVSFFKEKISWFSKSGDLILELGCGEHVGNAFIATLISGRKAILISTSSDKNVVCQKLSQPLSTAPLD